MVTIVIHYQYIRQEHNVFSPAISTICLEHEGEGRPTDQLYHKIKIIDEENPLGEWN